MGLRELDGARVTAAFAEDESGKEFEEFFRRLLERERERRHVVGTTQIEGPTKFGKGDGGKDSIVEVRDEPLEARATFTEPLTWDELGKTYYSLKGGKQWASSVNTDVGYSGSLTGLEKQENVEPKSPRSSDLLQHIVDGGRYVVVIGEQDGDSQKTIDKISKALAHHLKREDLQPPKGWEQKLHFFDANKLAAFIRNHRPLLPSELEKRLGLGWPSELSRYDEWTEQLPLEGRDLENYVPDPARNTAVEQLLTPDSPRVIRVFGPPGVGKTRLVHYALAEEAKRQSPHSGVDLSSSLDAIYYTDNPEHAESVLFGDWLKSDAAGLTLVVDEATSMHVALFARNFPKRAKSARVILIGMGDEDAQRGLANSTLGIQLSPLDEGAGRTLIMSILGDDDEQVDRVQRLAEGYPLFAVRLARALRDDKDALAKDNDETSRWSAAKRVLAGPRTEYENHVAWSVEATNRALCLLVVMMTQDQNLAWDALWERFGEDFAQVIGEVSDSSTVKKAFYACEKHGLLRRVGNSNRRYVSPANLARMILNHFFGDGDAPDFGGRLHQCGATLVDQVHRLAERYEANEAVRRKLAENFLEMATPTSLAKLVDARDALRFTASRLPNETARVLSTAICSFDDDSLTRQSNLRHGLRDIFEELVQSALSASAFYAAEGALFSMALVDDEAWSNNATGIWQSLFLSALSQTHQPWRLRFEILTQRCREGSDDTRAFALGGLALTTAAVERGLGHAPGTTWPRPSVEEILAQKREAWSLLLELCADRVEQVGAAARKAVVDNIRGCIMDDVAIDTDMVALIRERVDEWTTEQRRDLAETLTEVERYDYSTLQAELRDALDQLQAQLEAVGFAARLIAHVGSWHPGKWAINDPNRDDLEAEIDAALAAEAVAVPEQLLEQLAWLEGSAAKRRRSFLRTLGRLDTEHCFLGILEARVSEDPGTTPDQLLPWYLEGWAQVATDDVDRWLSSQRGGGPLERVATFALPLLRPTRRRIVLLIEQVKNGTADAASLGAMRGAWAKQCPPALVLDLIEACALVPRFVPPALSLLRVFLETQMEGKLEQAAYSLAAQLVTAATQQPLPTLHESDWSHVIAALLRQGGTAPAVDAAVSLASERSNIAMSGLAERILRTLFERGLANEVWLRAQGRLESGGGRLSRHLQRVNLLERISAESVLAWVGGRERRGAMIMSMSNPYASRLPDVVRQLLARFGAEGGAAQTLSARALSTPRAVSSLLDFKRQQLANTRDWQKSSEPEVRAWAAALGSALEDSISEGEAYAEFQSKLG